MIKSMKAKDREFQFSLFNMKNMKMFGGALLKNSNPKEKRPVSTKHPMHIVIRSSRAKGKQSFLTKSNKLYIDRILKKQAKIHGIKLYRHENVGNHIHILLKTVHRDCLSGFLRSTTGIIARLVLQVERGKTQEGKIFQLPKTKREKAREEKIVQPSKSSGKTESSRKIGSISTSIAPLEIGSVAKDLGSKENLKTQITTTVKSEKFWDARPFSRIVAWGRDYKNVLKYFEKNQLQAMGFSLNLLEQSLIEGPLNST